MAMDNYISSKGFASDDDEHFGKAMQRKNKFFSSEESDCDVDIDVTNAIKNLNEISKTDELMNPTVEKSDHSVVESQDSLNITRFDTNELLYENSQFDSIVKSGEDCHDEFRPSALSPARVNIDITKSENKKVFDDDIYDAEGSSDEEDRSRMSTTSPSKLSKSKKKKLDSIASDSNKSNSDDDSDEESKENSLPNENSIPENVQNSKLQRSKKNRKVANAVESETDQIHSEAQKLVRETVVSLPYHIPKQRTLADFLNRRKATPVMPLRTSVDNLTKVWKALEDREKTAEEFYQSSDSEAETEKEEVICVDAQTPDNCKPLVESTSVIDVKDLGTKLNEEKLEENVEFIVANYVERNVDNGSRNSGEQNSENTEENTAFKTREDGMCEVDSLEEKSLGIIEEKPVREDKIEAEEREMGRGSGEGVGAIVEKSEGKVGGLMAARLGVVPRLSAAPGDLIDLDSPAPGPVTLMHRFIKHVKLKPKQPTSSVNLSVLSTELNEGGEVVGISEDIVTVTSKNEVGPKHRNALKKSLQLSVKATRDLLVAKKLQQHKFYEEEIYDPSEEKEGFEKELEKDLEEDEALTDEGDETEDDEEDEVEEEEEEEYLENKKENKRGKNAFIDEEAEESEKECSSSEEAENILEKDTSSKDGNNEMASASIFSGISQFSADSVTGKESEDLLALCSGQFQTQPVSLSQLEESQQEDEDDDTPVVDKDLVSYFQNNTQRCNVIDSDDEDSAHPKMKTKTSMKLAFSDDEDSNSKMENIGGNDDEDREDEEIVDEENNPVDEGDDETIAETEEKFINDNSDDEISDKEEDKNKEVHYNSEEEIVEGRKFLEMEAELSGSEWGSADEDEKGLSDFEADQADDENINHRKLRTELERIHMREMLAEDKREVRLLQELLLEDGELHSDGPKRQRLYRWTNQDGFERPKGFSDDEHGGDEEEDEEEIKWRQQRIEREKYLQNCKKESKEEDEPDTLPLAGIEMKKKAPVQIKPNQPDFQSSPDPKHPFKLLTHRGSFLSRGDKVLSRLAGMVQSSEPSGATRVKRNMVFAVVSPPKQEPTDQPLQKAEKRKAKEDVPKASKKLKFDTNAPPKKQSSLFDKLKEFDALA